MKMTLHHMQVVFFDGMVCVCVVVCVCVITLHNCFDGAVLHGCAFDMWHVIS